MIHSPTEVCCVVTVKAENLPLMSDFCVIYDFGLVCKNCQNHCNLSRTVYTIGRIHRISYQSPHKEVNMYDSEIDKIS
jgi:hypothetical protein